MNPAMVPPTKPPMWASTPIPFSVKLGTNISTLPTSTLGRGNSYLISLDIAKIRSIPKSPNIHPDAPALTAYS